ncbi:unnamed protein product [Trichobilharzia szidati]|nr:unnamed protein product [Trichobilharzia szidati]
MTIPTSSHHDESLTETDDDIQISLGQHTPYHHNKSTGGINNTQDTTVENEEEEGRKCRGTGTPGHEVNFKQEDVQNDSTIITTQRSLLHQKQSSHESEENICNEKNDDKHSGDSGSETFDHKTPTHPHPAQKPVKPILRSDDSSVTTHVEEESTFYSTMHQRRIIDLQFLDILNRTRMIGGKMMLTEYSPEQYYKETLIIPELLCQTQHNSFEQNHRLNDIHGSSTSSRSGLQLDRNSVEVGCGVSEYAQDSTLTENEASYRSIAPTRKALKLGAIEEMLCAPLVNTGIHKEASRSDEAVFDALKGSGEEKPVAYFVEQECQNNQESHWPGRIYMPLTPTIEIQTTPLLGVPLNQYTMTTCCSVEVKAEKENGESREWRRTTKKEEATSDDIISSPNQQQHPMEQSSNKAVMQKPINAYLSDTQNQNSKANDNKLNLITNFRDNNNKKAHLKKRSISLSLDKLTQSHLSISKFILRLKIRSRSLGRLDLHHLSIEEGKVSGVDDSDEEQIEISARIHPFNFKEGIHKEANLGQTIFATEQSSYHDEIGFRRDVPQERSDDKVEKTETEKRQIWENEAVIETQLPPPPPPLNTEDSFSGSQTKHMEQLEAIDQPVLLKEDNTKNLKFKIEAEKTISEIQSPTQTQQEQEQDEERNEAYNDHDDDGEEAATESKGLSLPLPIEIGGGEGNDSFVEKYEIVPRRTNEETDDDQLEAISSEQSDENAEEEDMHMTTTTSSCGEESAKHSLPTSNLLLLSPSSIKEPHCANEIILESSLSYNEVNRQTTAKLTYTTTTASVPAHMNEFLTISMTSIVSPSIHYRSELSFTHQHSEQIKTSTPTTLSKLSETPVPTKSGESTTSSSIYYTAQSNPSGYGEIEVEVNEQDVVLPAAAAVAAAASVSVDKKDSYDESTLKEEDKTPMQNDDDAVINEAERETTGTETVKASSSSSSPSPSSQSEAQPDHLHQIEEVEGEEEASEHVDELKESIEEVNVEAIQSAPDILNCSLSENIVTYNVDGELNEQIAVVSLEVDHAQPSDIVDIHDMDTDTGVSKQLHLTQITTEQPLDDDENHQFQELTDATEPLVDDSQPPITVARTVEVERHHDDDHDDDDNELGEVSMNRQQPYQTTSHPINIKETSKVMQEHSAKSENKILLKQTHETVKMEDKQPEMETIHEEKYHDLYNVKDAREKNVPYESVSVLDRVPDTITSGLERKEEAESRSPKLVKKQHAVVMRETPIINTAPPQPEDHDNDDDAADDRQAKSTKLEISKVPVVMDNLTLAKTDTRADTPVIEFKTVDSPFEIRIKPMEVLQATGKSVSQTFGDDDELDEIKHPETSDIHLPEMFTLNEYEDKCEVKELTTTRGEDEEEHCQQMKHEKESPPTTNSVVVCVLVQVQQTPDTIIMRKEDNEMLTTPDELKQSYSLMDNEEEEAEGEIVQTEGVDITDYYLQSPLEDKITIDKEDEEEQEAYHDIKVNQYHKTNVTTKFNLTVNHFDIDDKMFSCSQSGRDIQPPTDLSSETQRLPSPLSPTSSSSSSSEAVDHHEIMQRQEDQEEAEEDPTMKRHFTQLKEDVNILKITSKCTYTSTPLKNYSLRQRTTTTRIPSSSFERSTSPQEYTVASTVCLPHSDGTTTANTTTTATYSESPYPAPTSSPSMTNLGWLLDSSSCLISRFDERLNKHLIEVSPNNRIFKKATITETSHHQLPTITATDQSPSQEQTTTAATAPPTTNRPEGNQLRITISQSIHFKGDKHTTSHSEIKKPTSSLALVDEESEEMYIARKLTNEALNKAIGKLSIGYTDIPSPPTPPPALSYSTQITQKKNKETQQQQQQKFSDEEGEGEEEEIITRLRQEYNIQLPSRIIDQHHRSTQSPLTIIMSTTPEDTTAPTPTTSIDTPFKIEQDVYSEVSKQTIAIHAKTRIYMFEADEGETKEEAQGEQEGAKEEEMKDTDVYPVNDANVIQSISQECSLNKTDNQVVLQTSLLVTSPKYLTQLIDEEITDFRVEQQHIGVISGSDYSTLAKYSPMDGGNDDDDDNNREVENLSRLRERQELQQQQQQQPQQQSPDGKTVTISPTSVVDDYMASEDNDDEEEDEGKSTQQQIQEELSALSFAAPSTHEFSGPVKKRGSDDRTQNDQPVEEEEEEQEDFTRPPDYVLTQTYQEISATDAITISQSADHPINDVMMMMKTVIS